MNRFLSVVLAVLLVAVASSACYGQSKAPPPKPSPTKAPPSEHGRSGQANQKTQNGQEGQAPSGGQTDQAAAINRRAEMTRARAAWESKIGSVRGRVSNREDLGPAVSPMASWCPHVPNRSPWYCSGGDQRQSWSLCTMPLDEDWSVVACDEPMSSVRVFGFCDLRPFIPEDLYDAVLAIHLCPSPAECTRADPVLMIRCVNLLWSLGKDKAIDAMTRYARLCGQHGDQPEYCLQADRVFTAGMLLFVSERTGGRMPVPRLGRFQGCGEAEDWTEWPCFPFALQDDVPFVLAGGCELDGLPESPYMAISYWRQWCELRAAPLTPSCPVRAASTLICSDRVARLVRRETPVCRDEMSTRLGMQGLRACEGAWKDCGVPLDCLDKPDCDVGEAWKAQSPKLATQGLAWDSGRRDFAKPGRGGPISGPAPARAK